MDDFVKKVKDEIGGLRQEAREKVTTYIAGGLGLVAGLAWNDAVRSLIDFLFPFSKNSLVAKFVYAAVLTLLVVILLFYLNRLLKKKG